MAWIAAIAGSVMSSKGGGEGGGGGGMGGMMSGIGGMMGSQKKKEPAKPFVIDTKSLTGASEAGYSGMGHGFGKGGF